MLRIYCVAGACLLAAAPALAGETIELTFVNHIQAEIVEQFVYVEREPGSGKVYRVTPADFHRYLDSPLYAAAESVTITPFDHGEIGPYGRGPALGFSLRDWLEATGTATYECEDDIGVVNARFDGLVPNGVYTMWYFFLPRPPLDPGPFVFLDVPLGARDGSDSPFIADADGHAEYQAVFSPCLQMSGRQLDANLAIAYHSDGQTYGTTPGPLSTVSHNQIFVTFPIEGR